MSNTTKQYVDLNGITVYDEEIKDYIDEKIDDTEISDLKDVSISSPTNGQSLVYNNTTHKWENSSSSGGVALSSLTDTNILNPSNGQALTYDSQNQEWINSTPATTLAGLTDTNISSETNGQVLKYNSSNSKWENGTIDISSKADKVTSATSGNFAGLDSNGNLTDSGSKASDFLTSHQDISGKADKVSGATNGNFASLDSNGNLTDSGHKHSDYLTSHQDISGKMNIYGDNAGSEVAFSGAFTVGTRGSGTVGDNSVTIGHQNVASGSCSYAAGGLNIAGYGGQYVIGQYNDNKSTTLFEIGNGSSTSNRGNAFEVYNDGTVSTDNGATKHKLGVLQINPTDATFKATPGAIWIET